MNISHQMNQLTLPARLVATFLGSVLPLPIVGGISIILWLQGAIDEHSLVMAITFSLVVVLILGTWVISRLAIFYPAEEDAAPEQDPLAGVPGKSMGGLTDHAPAGENLFDVFMAHLPAMAFIKNSDGRYAYFNAACCEILNRSPEKVVGRTDGELWPEDIAQALGRNDEQIMSGDQLLNGIERVAVGSEERCYLVTKFPIDGGSTGNMLGGIAFDITDKVRAEEDNARLEQQLIQSQKMEAIGTLAGGIAHDFNNVLAAIMGYTELASLDAEPDSTVRYELDQVIAATLRAKDLVRQILSFSRRNDSDRQPLDPKPLVKEALTLLRASIPSTIEIRQAYDLDGVQVVANATQLHQVIMNLCTNASHAMEDHGGVLDVRLQKISLTGATAGRQGVAPGRYLELRIRDTGQGITPSVKKRIFDPYFTTKDKGKGTGMGLAVVQGILQSHGGSIDVESRPGDGACFIVLLPITSSVTQIPARERVALPKGRESILFVDDEPVLVELAQQMLTRLGYRVTSFDHSPDALALIEKDPQYFDLVITDTTMPQMTGDALAGRIRQIRPDLPVILCTGYSEQMTSEKAAGSGIAAFLMKPLAISDLSFTVRHVLDNRMTPLEPGYLKAARE